MSVPIIMTGALVTAAIVVSVAIAVMWNNRRR